jgi:hypothetical protein
MYEGQGMTMSAISLSRYLVIFILTMPRSCNLGTISWVAATTAALTIFTTMTVVQFYCILEQPQESPPATAYHKGGAWPSPPTLSGERNTWHLANYSLVF